LPVKGKVVEEKLRRVLEEIEKVEELLARFESALLDGTLAEALRRLIEAYGELSQVYPPASAYHERSILLLEYVEALRVRASLYGLRNYFREVEYVESHVRDLKRFAETVSSLLGVSPRASSRARGASGKSHVYPGV